MGVIRRVAQAIGRWGQRGTSLESGDAAAIFGVRPTLSGVSVTEETALEAPDYFASVRNPAEDLATLPLVTYRRGSNGIRERDEKHYLFPILHDAPNEETDITTFVECLQAHLMIRRNSYAEIQRDGAGRCRGLWQVHPSRVYMERLKNPDGSPGELVYTITLPEGQRDSRTGLPFVVLDRSRMFHLRAFALDGLTGVSSLSRHAEAIGRTLAIQRYGAAFFGNGATPGGVIEVEGTLGDKAYQRLLAAFEARHKGVDRSHRIALLEEKAKWKETAVPNDKAQFIESERQSTESMARLNRIPPHLIGDLSRATFSNIEHQAIDYVVHSIRPHAVRWERAIRAQVYTPEDRQTHFSEFLLDALLRGDSQSRANTLAVWRQNGVINADEWRLLENMNPIGDDSGSDYWRPLNMQASPITEQINAVGVLVRAGYDPEAALEAVGLPSIKHSGAPPVTVQAEESLRALLPLYRAAAERCLRKEAVAVDRAIDRVLKAEGMRAFEGWLVEFYRQQGETIRQTFAPLAEAVGEIVRGETGPGLGEWVQTHVRGLAASRAKAAQEQIRGVVASGPTDLVGALHKMTAEWAGQSDAVAARELRATQESARRYVNERAAALSA